MNYSNWTVGSGRKKPFSTGVKIGVCFLIVFLALATGAFFFWFLILPDLHFSVYGVLGSFIFLLLDILLYRSWVRGFHLPLVLAISGIAVGFYVSYWLAGILAICLYP